MIIMVMNDIIQLDLFIKGHNFSVLEIISQSKFNSLPPEWCCYVSVIMMNIGLGNGLVPDGSKLFPEAKLNSKHTIIDYLSLCLAHENIFKNYVCKILFLETSELKEI